MDGDSEDREIFWIDDSWQIGNPWEVVLDASIWGNHRLHFSSAEKPYPYFSEQDLLSEEDIYDLATEEGESISWEEYLREEAEDF